MAELTPEELAYAERQQKEYEAFVERDPTFSERFEATLGDIGTGLKEAPAQILRGAQEGLNAASDASYGIAEWLNKNVINLDGVANAIGVTEDKNHLRFSDGAMPAKPASVTGTLVNDVSQFVTGFVTAGRFLKDKARAADEQRKREAEGWVEPRAEIDWRNKPLFPNRKAIEDLETRRKGGDHVNNNLTSWAVRLKLSPQEYAEFVVIQKWLSENRPKQK